MALSEFIKPWTGEVFRHIPKLGDPLDFQHAGMTLERNWNLNGQKTLYFAGDKSILLAEFSRHFNESRSETNGKKLKDRRIYRFKLSLEHVLDLTDVKTRACLSLPDPKIFLLKEMCRSTASFIRTVTNAQAIIVPSVAFMDDLTRWNLVVFLEKLGPLEKHFKSVEEIGW